MRERPDIEAIKERWGGFAYDRGLLWTDLYAYRADVPALVAHIEELEDRLGAIYDLSHAAVAAAHQEFA